MKIIDLNGHEMEITDLQLALMQADDYRHYRTSQPNELCRKRQAYWEDIYQKLVKLREQQQD